MKVLFIIRATAFDKPGGDTVQARNTAKYLKESGVEAELKLTSEQIDYSQYRLIHFFNIIRPADILKHAIKANLPYVISPVFMDYREYDRKMRGGLMGILGKIVPMDTMEYLKVLARRIKNRERVQSRLYLYWGHRRSVRHLVQYCQMLLPNSESEIKRLFGHYNTWQRYTVVPNGIDEEVFKPVTKMDERQQRGIICVAQVEGRKNQLNLIRAINPTGLHLTIIGKPTANSGPYFEACKKEAGGHVTFTDYIPLDDLLEYYRFSKLHVLPSWFETTGLSSLEAAAMGCNIVITRKGDTEEYFGDHAFYCDPADVSSIRKAVLKAYEAPVDTALEEMVRQRYTWRKAAEKTYGAYKKLGL